MDIPSANSFLILACSLIPTVFNFHDMSNGVRIQAFLASKYHEVWVARCVEGAVCFKCRWRDFG